MEKAVRNTSTKYAFGGGNASQSGQGSYRDNDYRPLLQAAWNLLIKVGIWPSDPSQKNLVGQSGSLMDIRLRAGLPCADGAEPQASQVPHLKQAPAELEQSRLQTQNLFLFLLFRKHSGHVQCSACGFLTLRSRCVMNLGNRSHAKSIQKRWCEHCEP